MSQRQNLYVGRAGQMAVMAEFLLRGWNVAFPEVDVGEDVFVVKDETGDLSRVQVKTATAKPLLTGYAAQFSVSLDQLLTQRFPDLIYVFAIRSFEGWGRSSFSAETSLPWSIRLTELGASAGKI